MKRLAIVGAGGHGGVVADAAELSRKWSKVEFYDEQWPKGSLGKRGPVVGNLAKLRDALAGPEGKDLEVIVAIGNNERRLAVSREIQSLGGKLATVIHPSAILSPSATLGAGTAVLAGAVLNPNCSVGAACIINTRASVDHDCVVEDGVHICPGVAIAGDVTVQERAWIGIGASVIQGLRIGQAAVVGAGSTVIADVRENSTVVGCPAKEKSRA